MELNEKLARWIGFEVHLTGTPTGRPEMWQSMGKIGGYANRGWINFADSLDACFKWLVPEAVRLLCKVGQLTTASAKEELFHRWVDRLKTHPFAVGIEAADLCAVIDELIDSEVKRGN